MAPRHCPSLRATPAILLSILSTASALHVRFGHALDAAGPQITGAPSPASVDLRLARRQNAPNGGPLGGSPECAADCIDNALEDFTDCQPDDLACRCDPVNASKIASGAAVCVSACGWQGNIQASSIGYSICKAYYATANPDASKQSTAINTGHSYGWHPGDTTTVTTILNGAATSTSTPQSASSSPTSSDTSLSKAATAGVAVGATLGGVALAALVFLIWRRTRRRQPPTPAAFPPAFALAAAAAGPTPPPLAATTDKPDRDLDALLASLGPAPPEYASPAPTFAHLGAPPVYPGLTPGGWRPPSPQQEREQEQHDRPGQVPVSVPLPPVRGAEEVPGMVYQDFGAGGGGAPGPGEGRGREGYDAGMDGSGMYGMPSRRG